MPGSSKAERRVVAFAAASRACVSALALLTALLLTPYDTSAHLQAGGSPLAAFANWDGVYFAHIARSGYDYEHFHAFFPLYPLLMRLLSRVLPLDASVGIVVSGWLLSNASFVLAALFLYRLGRLVLQDEVVARRAAYLFCFAPSSIFMSAVYTESLMALLSFSGMFYLERHARDRTAPRASRDLLLSALLFGAASATRSNGALLSLFIAWHRVTVSPSPVQTPRRFLGFWLRTAGLGLLAVGPQVSYFLLALLPYCPALVERLAPGLATAATTAAASGRPDRAWCADVLPNVSAMYMFIQKEYWDVGLLRYYEWKQLPNFALAAPVVMLSGHALFGYFLRGAPPTSSRASDWRGLATTPYYAHWLFLLVNALLVVHIQVTTRLLSACPPLFWHPAALCSSTATAKAGALTGYGRVVVGYFLLFSVLGSVLFPAFYPWT